MKTKYYFLSLVAFVLCSFVTKTDDSDYEKEIREWHKNRIEGLKKENGWLNLAGLFWLKKAKTHSEPTARIKLFSPKTEVKKR